MFVPPFNINSKKKNKKREKKEDDDGYYVNGGLRVKPLMIF